MTRSRLPRPRRAAMPVAASAAVLGVWWAVAHDSGSGWAQAVGALIAGALVVGILGPAVALSLATCRAVAAPRDASAGAVVGIEVSSSAPAELLGVDPPGPAVVVPGGRRHAILELRPARRGMLDRATVTIATAAPCGILWWTRTVTLALPRPIAVAPRIGLPESDPRRAGASEDAPRAAPGRGDEPRGVRPYEVGDRRTLVHWPASAHTGSLMVREAERPRQRAAVVDGRLPTDPDGAERRAERVMATVRALLLAGARVELETVEEQGTLVAPVTSLSEAGRRLARALPQAR